MFVRLRRVFSLGTFFVSCGRKRISSFLVHAPKHAIAMSGRYPLRSFSTKHQKGDAPSTEKANIVSRESISQRVKGAREKISVYVARYNLHNLNSRV